MVWRRFGVVLVWLFGVVCGGVAFVVGAGAEWTSALSDKSQTAPPVIPPKNKKALVPMPFVFWVG
jgi:hypothetical protein